MFLDAIGLTLPFAMAIALGPIPIIAAILVVSSSPRRLPGWCFALGWLVGIALLTALVGLLLDAVSDTTQDAAWLNWLRIGLGLLLLWAAVRKLRAKPQAEETGTPKWLAMFDGIGAAKAARLGVMFAAINPKHLAFAMTAMSSLTYAADTAADLALSVATFSLLSTLSVIAIMLIHGVGGDRATALLDGAKQFMLRHSKVIVAIIFALLGASIFGTGLAGLND